MTDEEKKQRNYLVAGAVSGFLLPLVGFAGAAVYATRGEGRPAWILGMAGVFGLIAYVILFALL